MKKLSFFLIIISIFTSCNKFQEEEFAISHEIETANFIGKIDSLNNVYSKKASFASTRGLLSDYLYSTAADAVGGWVGGKLGSLVGSSAGAATGNPVVAVGGYLVGRKFGSKAGAAVASIGAAWVIKNYGSETKTLITLNESYTVPVENYKTLSDGELHNLILANLLSNMGKYILKNGELNYSLLLEDAYYYENYYAPCKDYEYIKKAIKTKAIEQTKRIVKSSVLLIDHSEEFYLNDVYNNLIEDIKLPKKEFDEANILNKKVLPTYRKLDSECMLEYEKDVNEIIDSAKIDNNLKVELKSSNSIIKNSTEIWREAM